MKNTAFWDVAPCGFYENRAFGGSYHLHHQGERISELGTLAVTNTRDSYCECCSSLADSFDPDNGGDTKRGYCCLSAVVALSPV
jgi:hypothetical protein